MLILALSEVAREVDLAFKIIGGICTALFVGIILVMLLFLFKYQRSRSPRTAQIHGHTVLEITWIILPTLLVTYMFFVGYKGFKLMRSVPKDHMVVEVTGQQWAWSFYYPDEDVHSNKLYLPGGKAVKFLLHSPINDVLHSFYLPDFRIKEDCVPGQDNYMWIRPDMPQPGEKPTSNIFCAEFCGKDHSKMISELTILTPQEYDQWIAEKIAEKNKPVAMELAMNPKSAEIQKRSAASLYKTYCISCHGAGGRGEAETAVPKARNFTTLANWKQGTKRTNIFRTITTGIPGTQMVSFIHLPTMDRFALMHYVSSFYSGSDRPVDSEKDVEQLKVDFALDKPPAPKKTLTIDQAMGALIHSENTDLSQADSHYGQTLFTANCSICHQADGRGQAGLAPSIRNRDFLAIASDDFIRQTVLKGRIGTAMVGQKNLTKSNVTDIISYLRSLKVANPVKITVDPEKTFHGNVLKGQTKFAQYCASCHGPNGEGYMAGGSGPAIGLPGFLDAVSDDYIFQTVKQGRVGTAMMPYMGPQGLANLSETDVHDIIAHLRDLRKTSPLLARLNHWVEPGNPNTGRMVFQRQCIACHQAGGVGKPGLAPSIRNRDFLAIASDDFIRKTVRQGRVGTAMVPRPDLSDTDVNHVIAYLRSLKVANPVKITVDSTRKMTGDAKSGQRKYATFCSSCHGPNGEGYAAGGSGPGIGLPGFLDIVSDDYIIQTVKQGRVGTAMMPFIGARGLANLSETDISDIIVYLRRSERNALAAMDARRNQWEKPDAQKGRRLFQTNCAACHQADGKGKPGLAPSIRNRDFLAMASDEFITETIRKGRAGTAMAPRPYLYDSQINHIIAYLRSLKIANPVEITVDTTRKIGGDADNGQMLFAQFCSSCHGHRGEGYVAGGSGPGIGLPGFLDVVSDDYIFQTVKQGRVGTAMMPFIGARGLANLSEKDVGDIIAHLRYARETNPFVSSLPEVVEAGDAIKGKPLFLTHCSACHQPGGVGKPGLAPSIRNRDFLAMASDELIKSTVRNGRIGTAMAPRPDLTESQLNHIIAYLRSLDIPNPVNIVVDRQRKISGNADNGQMLFAQFCSSCHGHRGEGYAAGGSGPGIGLPGFLNVVSDDYIFQTVKHGRIGTAMMPFMGPQGLANLTEPDVKDVVSFLRSL